MCRWPVGAIYACDEPVNLLTNVDFNTTPTDANEDGVLAALLAMVPVALFVFAPDGTLIRSEGKRCADIGLGFDCDKGRSFEELFFGYPDIGSAIQAAFNGDDQNLSAYIGGVPYDVKCRFEKLSHQVYLTAVEKGINHQPKKMQDDTDNQIGTVLDVISDGVLTISEYGRIKVANQPAAKIFGLPANQIKGEKIGIFLPELAPVKGVSFRKKLHALFAVGTVDTLSFERSAAMDALSADKMSFPVDVTVREIERHSVREFVLRVVDLRERQLVEQALEESRRVERALQESEQRYTLAAHGANVGLWDWDLEKGRILYSDRWKAVLGLKDLELEGTPDEWFVRTYKDDVPKFCDALDHHLEGSTAEFHCEFRMQHECGEYRWMEVRGVAVRQEDGTPYRIAGSLSDISDRKMIEARLMHEAHHDALTNLPNRTYIQDRANQCLEALKRLGTRPFAVALCDIDRFKSINQSLGFAGGDILLKEISDRLTESLPKEVTCARLDADCFAFLFEDFSDPEDKYTFLRRVRDRIAEPFVIDGNEIFVSASFGVAEGRVDYRHATDIFQDADIAVNRAKQVRLTGLETFDAARHRLAFDSLQMETELRRAIEDRTLKAFYQPIVSLANDRISGFEALARIVHPEHGISPPGVFIDIAEETGLIIPLGRRILENACAQLVEWRERIDHSVPLTISANVSARQLADENVVDTIFEVLLASGLNPKDLKLEITESMIMTDPEMAASRLAQIKDLGVQLMLDDFGTGFSSLSYLRRFPIDYLKMDRSFVGRIDTDEKDCDLVKMIVELAHTLGLKVVAEGVERQEHVDLLKSIGCEFGQGFFYSRPQSAADTEALLLENNLIIA